MSARTLRLDQIAVPADVHRIDINDHELRDLAASIEQLGLLNPINVSDNGNDSYTLVAGHRRYLACQMLHRTHIDCTILTGSKRDTEAARFAENMHRAQLTPMEEAYAIQHQHTHNVIPVATIARMLHRSEDWVEQRLALVKMPPELCDLVHRGSLPIGSALALANVTDDAHRRYLTTYATTAGAAVTVIREWVKQWQLTITLDPSADAPRPEMPEPGAPVVVTMPCYCCGDPHPYQFLRVARMCAPCAEVIARGVALDNAVPS